MIFLGNKHNSSPWTVLGWRAFGFRTRAINRICCTSVSITDIKNKSQNNPFIYFQRAMRYIISQTCLLREIHCSNYFGAFSSSFVQKQKEMHAWMGIFLEVNSILESPCNIKLWILLNSLLWNGENSSLGALCLSFWQRSIWSTVFVFFPQVCTSEWAIYWSTCIYWCCIMVRQSKIINLAHSMIVVYFAFNFLACMIVFCWFRISM